MAYSFMSRSMSQDENAAKARASFMALLCKLNFILHVDENKSYWKKHLDQGQSFCFVFVNLTRSGIVAELEVYIKRSLVHSASFAWSDTNQIHLVIEFERELKPFLNIPSTFV